MDSDVWDNLNLPPRPSLYDEAIRGMQRVALAAEIERKVAEWEAPFPMDARTQQDMAVNRHAIVQAYVDRCVRLVTSDPPYSLWLMGD